MTISLIGPSDYIIGSAESQRKNKENFRNQYCVFKRGKLPSNETAQRGIESLLFPKHALQHKKGSEIGECLL